MRAETATRAPAAGELARDAPPDPAAAAGDEDDLAVEPVAHATARSISSSASGFSSDDRSPGSRPSAFARTARRMILALRVFGSAVDEDDTVRLERAAQLGADRIRDLGGELRRRLVRPA